MRMKELQIALVVKAKITANCSADYTRRSFLQSVVVWMPNSLAAAVRFPLWRSRAAWISALSWLLRSWLAGDLPFHAGLEPIPSKVVGSSETWI